MSFKERDIATFCGGFCLAIVVGIFLLGLVLSTVSCTATRPGVATALPATAPNLALVQQFDSAALQNWLPQPYASLPAYLVPPPAGSTPRQRRQWQRAQAQNLARAGVLPAKIKNSSVATAPGATAVNRPTAPVATNGSTATDARKAGTRGGAAAVGRGAVATSTHHGTPWWVLVLVAIAGAVGWEILAQHVLPLKWIPWRTQML